MFLRIFIKDVSNRWTSTFNTFINGKKGDFDSLPAEDLPDEVLSDFTKSLKELKNNLEKTKNIKKKKEIIFPFMDSECKRISKFCWDNKILKIEKELDTLTKDLPDNLIADFWGSINKWKKEYDGIPQEKVEYEENYIELKNKWRSALDILQNEWNGKLKGYPDKYGDEYDKLGKNHTACCCAAFFITVGGFGFVTLLGIHLLYFLGILNIQVPSLLYPIFVSAFMVSFFARIMYALRPYDRIRFASFSIMGIEERKINLLFKTRIYKLVMALNTVYVGDKELQEKFELLSSGIYKEFFEKEDQDTEKIKEFKNLLLRNINYIGTSYTTPNKIEKIIDEFKNLTDCDYIDKSVIPSNRKLLTKAWVHLSSTVNPSIIVRLKEKMGRE